MCLFRVRFLKQELFLPALHSQNILYTHEDGPHYLTYPGSYFENCAHIQFENSFDTCFWNICVHIQEIIITFSLSILSRWEASIPTAQQGQDSNHMTLSLVTVHWTRDEYLFEVGQAQSVF